MSQDFDKQISRLEEQLEALRGKMVDARSQWLDQLAPKIATYWDRAAELSVTAEADHANELGLGQLKAIKAEIREMTNGSRAISETKLVDERKVIWPDLAPQTDPYDRAFSGGGPGSGFRLHNFFFEEDFKRGQNVVSGPDVLNDPVQRLAGEVDYVLRSHGFEARRSVHSEPQWSWDEELADAINVYADLHDEYTSTLTSLAMTRASKAKAEAKSLWDEA